MLEHTHNPKVKGLNPATGTRRYKLAENGEKFDLSADGMMVEHLTPNPEIEGWNPVSGTCRLGGRKWQIVQMNADEMMVEHLPHNPEIKGLKQTTCTKKYKMAKCSGEYQLNNVRTHT